MSFKISFWDRCIKFVHLKENKPAYACFGVWSGANVDKWNFIMSWARCKHHTIISNQRDTLLQRASKNFQTMISDKISIKYRLDLQNQWNLHVKWKANHYPDQSYSVCVRWVFLSDYTKNVDSNIAPKTRAIINIDMLHVLRLNNDYMLHDSFNSNFYTVFLIEVCILFTTTVCVWYANFIEIENPIVGLIMIVVWKFKTARWSEVACCLENDSIIW